MASPGTPTMQQMQMNMPQAYPYSYSVGQPPPNVPGYDTARGKPKGNSRGSGRDRKQRGGRLPVQQLFASHDPASDNYIGPAPSVIMSGPSRPLFLCPDLAPETGNFERMLTDTQAYGNIPIVPDPSISYNAQQQYYNQYQQNFGYPPQSPQPGYRNPNYSGPNMPPTYGGQGVQGPPSMSRQSSQMSAAERPGSSLGQTPSASAPASHHQSGRTASVSSEIQRPVKRSAAIVIKNPHGEVVDFKKPTPAITPAVPAANPSSSSPSPSRSGSAFEAAQTPSASQAAPVDSSDKSKAMREAVARRIAENEEKEKAEAVEAEKLRKAKEAAEEKARMDEEARQAAAREAEEKRIAAEKAEQEAARAAEELKQREEEARAAEEKAKVDQAAQAVPPPSKSADDGEIDLDALAAEMEAEEAAREAEELRKEEEYNKRKAAQREAQRKKEQEEAEEYERTMKEAERKAEEEEAAREKKRDQGEDSDDVEARKMFETLKAGGTLTPQTDEEGAAKPTPGGSGVATPVSDLSMGPPRARRSRAAELTLDTKKSVEPSEPSATLKSLNSARLLDDLSKVSYPSGFVSPNPALNASAPADKKFKYDKEFLLQFQSVFKEKPSLDWDQKIRDVFGDGDSTRPQTARTPSSMGGRSASNRGPSNTVFGGPMGSLGGARPLPPGTTSEQRFAASNAARGGMNNAFAMGRGIGIGGRTPSNNPLGIPGSPRVGGSARGASRAESKRGKQGGKQEHEQNKAMPLTAGMDVGSLQTSSTGWKPRSLGTGAGNASVGLDGYMEADVVQRKVKAALNKMTPENFDRISQQILTIAAQSKSETDGRTLRQVIQLVFEKATDEAHWASMYAKFCAEMLMNMSSDIKDEGIKDKNGQVVTGGNLFRKYLLNRCQEEFEKGWKINLPEPKEGESKEVTMLSDEYYEAAAAKRRGLGLVKFIGELFKLNMLTERIMHECVKKLLDYKGTPDEAEVESLCSLLRTIGKQIDSPESRVAGAVDMYFERINQTMNLPDLPSRMRFMLLDIIDLRKAGWVSKDSDKGPKTIQQIHEEAEAAKQREELARLASQANARGGGRMPMGRGDARSFSYNQGPPVDNSGRVNTDDLRRLNNRVKSSVPTGSFGPSGLGARTNSGRRGLGPALNRAEEGNATSRTGTPPAQKEVKKDESNQNAFRYEQAGSNFESVD